MNLSNRDFLPLGAVDLIVTAANWTTNVALGMPYQTLDGVWHIWLHIKGSDSGNPGLTTITVQGVTFLEQQALAFFDGNGGEGAAFANNGASTISLVPDTATNTRVCTGDVRLESKPTFME